MRLNAKQITYCTGGELLVEPIDASSIMCGITWDSRDVQPGWLYVALPGEHTDGHRFVEAALRAGAAGALVSETPERKVRVLARELGASIIGVPDTMHAITDIAREWRRHLRGRVIGLTGSTGKTTTKNLVRDVCASTLTVAATKANQNNELGVPITLLAADPDTQVVVVEMGMRGAGQIAELCDVVRPDWGLITNIGESHIELLGSREAIARAKAELFCALPSGTGRAFANAADEASVRVAQTCGIAGRNVGRVWFGGAGPAEAEGAADAADEAEPAVWAEDVQLDAEGRPRFTLCARGFVAAPSEPTLFDVQPDVERASCHMALRGMHNVGNACAAAAVGRALGIPLGTIADALASSLPEVGRQQVMKARAGYTVVNDAYNANPDSMRAALEMFCSMEVAGKRWAVLGDMGELGDFSCECHRGVGRVAGGLPIDALVCVGDLAGHIAEGAIEAGMEAERIVCVPGVAGALEQLEGAVAQGDAVLVKASHFMGLDRLAEGLAS